MRWMLLAAPLFASLVASPVRAQDAQPTVPPEAPSPPPASPEPPPAVPSVPQVSDGEQPPAPRTPPPPAPRHREVSVEEPAASPGFGLEAATAGFASGKLDGGIILGVHFPGGSLFGLRLGYKDETRKIGSESMSQTAMTVGVAGRFALMAARAGFDLALGLDGAYIKAQITSSSSGSASAEASGFHLAIGPQLRYWITPNLAVGYLVQASFTQLTSESSSSSSELGFSSRSSIEDSTMSIDGTFTLTAGF
jgi:hypothetical protein